MRDFPDVSWADSALLLYGAGFGGSNDGRWVRDDGVADVTVVDIDPELLSEMEQAYPRDWKFVCEDAIEFIADSLHQQWDVVVADPFGGDAMDECHRHLAELFHMSRQVIIGAERSRAAPSNATVWPRAGETGEYCWWVLP